MKGDDDTFVKVDAVINEARKVPDGRSFYIGNINYYHKPLRDGKWAVTYEVTTTYCNAVLFRINVWELSRKNCEFTFLRQIGLLSISTTIHSIIKKGKEKEKEKEYNHQWVVKHLSQAN